MGLVESMAGCLTVQRTTFGVVEGSIARRGMISFRKWASEPAGSESSSGLKRSKVPRSSSQSFQRGGKGQKQTPLYVGGWGGVCSGRCLRERQLFSLDKAWRVREEAQWALCVVTVRN
jgi:hypothetical protein